MAISSIGFKRRYLLIGTYNVGGTGVPVCCDGPVEYVPDFFEAGCRDDYCIPSSPYILCNPEESPSGVFSKVEREELAFHLNLFAE